MKKVLILTVMLVGVMVLSCATGSNTIPFVVWINANAAYNRGVNHLNNGDYNNAITEFTAAINGFPYDEKNRANSHLGRANAYYQIGDYDNAITDYDKAIADYEAVLRIYPNSTDTSRTARSNLALAQQQQQAVRQSRQSQSSSEQVAQSQPSSGQTILTQTSGEQTVTPAPPQTIVTVEQGNNLTEKFDWLKAFAQSNTSYIVEVRADESIGDQSLSYSGKNIITITLKGVGANRTLSGKDPYTGRDLSAFLFTVSSGVTLVLDNNITLRGGRVSVDSGGSLIMNNGSNNSGVDVSGKFIMNGGTISRNTAYGSGVSIGSGGTFTMNNGTISGFTAFSSYGVGSGGGVYVGASLYEGNGTFIMNGGTISGNTATVNGGGVYVYSGTFTMNSGIISRNTAGGGGGGGGVYVAEKGTFTMSGGTISGNVGSSSGGGGVYVLENGTFTMSGGTISGNTSASDGGGVYLRESSQFNNNSVVFTMSGGTISNNTSSNGGGVYVGLKRTFTMIDGNISGNTATVRGGGVYVSSNFNMNGAFVMRNGTVSNNTASSGGGVYVNESGTFTMNNGIILGNTVRENGGGVYVHRNGTFTKTGGTIYGYSANDQRNSNVVKNSSGAVQNFRGHAVWAGSTENLLKIREGTAGPGDNMSYNDSTRPPTASGAWDN